MIVRSISCIVLAVGVFAVIGCRGSNSNAERQVTAISSMRDNLLRPHANQRTDVTYIIPSSSMEPTLHCARPRFGCESNQADRILVREYDEQQQPARGDIVAVDTPPKALTVCGSGGTYIKRIIGLPGDTWAEKHGVIYINAKPLDERWVAEGRRDDESWRTRKLSADQYFVMGDNRKSSCDSRRWGTVGLEALVGRTIGVYWPESRFRVE